MTVKRGSGSALEEPLRNEREESLSEVSVREHPIFEDLDDPLPEDEDEGVLHAPRPRTWGRHALVSFGITLVLLGIMAWQLDFEAVTAELKRCDKSLALLGLLAHYATYPVRGMRWKRCLVPLPVNAGTGRFGLMVFFYNFVDNVVPGMLGQVYAAHLARINLGVSRAAALGSIVFLRLIDAWVVLGVAAISSLVVFSDQLPPSVVQALTIGIVVAAVGTLVILTFYWLHRLQPMRLPESIQRRIASFRTGMWPERKQLPRIIILSVVIWALEVTWVLALAAAFDIHLGLSELLFLTMVPLLSSGFPLTPSGAGVVELTLFGCLRALGVGSVVAASLTVMNRFIDYWLHIMLGVLVWALRDRIGLSTWRDSESVQLARPELGESSTRPGSA